MRADIKEPHLDFFGGAQQPFTPLWTSYNLSCQAEIRERTARSLCTVDTEPSPESRQ